MNLSEINRKEFFAKWTAALRSRKYKRAEGGLKTEAANTRKEEEGMCCLGVACDILSKEYGYGKWGGDSGRLFVTPNGVKANGMPQDSILKWMFDGIKHKDDIGIAGMLATANDHGRSFGKTANVIDRLAKQIV